MKAIVRFAAATALALTCGSGLAATLYKCGSRGAAIYQTEPCAAGTRTLGQREYEPEPAPPTEPDGRDARQEPLARRPAGGIRPSRRRAAAQEEHPSASCADVRRRRDAWEQSVGLRRTYDELRAWNDRVRDACR